MLNTLAGGDPFESTLPPAVLEVLERRGDVLRQSHLVLGLLILMHVQQNLGLAVGELQQRLEALSEPEPALHQPVLTQHHEHARRGLELL